MNKFEYELKYKNDLTRRSEQTKSTKDQCNLTGWQELPYLLAQNMTIEAEVHGFFELNSSQRNKIDANITIKENILKGFYFSLIFP